MKSFLMKVRCFWQDMIKPLVAACCGPVRLVTKMYLAAMFAGSFFCFVLCASAVLFQQGNRSDVLRWAIGFAAGCLVVSIMRFLEYERRLDEAWRDKAKTGGVSIENLLEQMQYRPSKRDYYSLEEASLVSRLCSMKLLVGSSLSSGILCRFWRLEQRGWISLTFNKEVFGVPMPAAQLTEQAWAAIDELRPWGWSPEDQPHPPVVGTPSPA